MIYKISANQIPGSQDLGTGFKPGTYKKAYLVSFKEDSKVTFWFHTLRRKRNLDSLNYYSWTFAKDNHEAWVNKNHLRDKYVNELYISVLYEGESLNNEKNELDVNQDIIDSYLNEEMTQSSKNKNEN